MAKTTSKTRKPAAAKPAASADTGSRALQLSSFTEINRMHRQALSAKRGTLVVTGATSGEGSSTFAHIMALRSADNGQRTLLIDLNMRNAGLSQAFAAERKNWRLSEREVNQPLSDLVEPIADVPNLYFMAAPRDDNSVQFLRDVQRASYFFATLEKDFDHIVVDTTPTSAVNRLNADPVMLAAAATRTVLVMMAGVTPADRIKTAARQLEDGGATLEGVLVNDYRNPSVKDDLLRFAESFQGMSPDFSAWLRSKILSSKLFS